MIRAVISDLGNVLLHFDHRLIIQRLAKHLPGTVWDHEQEQQFWPLMHEFECGSLDTPEFLARTGRALCLPQSMSEEEFRMIWADIFWPNEEFLQLLSSIRERVTLVMLSNTNPLHIEFARKRFPEVFDLFSRTVFSYETGKSKPERAMFNEALLCAGCEADEAIYFDDIAAYADAASALGMHGYQYVSIEGARDVLRMYDVLPL
ncbi:MAG: HAD-IA family hydrolase [Bacteroidetes bacterium]|nr:HAD-IA family hydrolase [Bacteroidota bacterium]